MVRALAISLVFFAALAALGALFVARRVLSRIDAINTSAHGIMAGDLTQRLPVSGSGDELDRLAEGLNGMLARIGELMQGLREVTDNIAHDLRTPLTRLRNHAEAALAFGGDANAYRAALEKTIEESDALIKIFNALLLIARAEAGGDVEAADTFDVGEAAHSVAELYEPIAEEEGVVLKVETEGELTVRGNRELIGQTIANLVDNALKYGASKDGRRAQAGGRHFSAAGGAVGRARHRRPGSGHRAGRQDPGARAVRAARGLALASGFGAGAVARRRGRAHAWRNGRTRGQRAGACRPGHASGLWRAAAAARARQRGRV